MEDNTEDNIESKEDKDAFKKDLEVQKLQKELKKLDLESNELKWRKFSAWGPTVIALITVGVTAFITYNTQIFDVTSKEIATRNNLIQIQNLLLDARKDSLTISNDKLTILNDKLRSDSIQRVKELKDIKNEISSLRKNFKNEETRYKNLLVKREYLIKKLGVMTDSLGKEIVKAEDCYSKAKELLMICVKDVYDDASRGYIFMPSSQRKNYPLKTRLRKTDYEIAEMELSKMNTIQFLSEIAYFEVKNELSKDKTMILSQSLVSKDGAINIRISTLMPGNLIKKQKYIMQIIGEIFNLDVGKAYQKIKN